MVGWDDLTVCVTKWKALDKGTLKGFVFLHVEELDLDIYDVAIFENENGRWVRLPTREWQPSQGPKKYLDIMKITVQNTNDKFRDKVLEALEIYLTAPPAVPDRGSGAKKPEASGGHQDDIPF
jgi:DNA-binding cell septation regulator SpoVG